MNALSYKQVSKCFLCPTLGKDHVPASGNPNAKVMIIGQSPGAQEVERRQPFVGPCGDLLSYMLDEAELTIADVYITNTVKCRPPGNRAGSPVEITNCKKTWLLHEVRSVRPKVILLLGKDAFKAVGPRDKEFEHMSTFENAKLACVFLVAYHPGYFLRNQRNMDQFILVGRKLKELVENG